MNIYNTQIFTGIPEIDTYILLKMSGKDLYNICQINSYVYNLCNHNKYIKNHINRYLLTINHDFTSLLEYVCLFHHDKYIENCPYCNQALDNFDHKIGGIEINKSRDVNKPRDVMTSVNSQMKYYIINKNGTIEVVMLMAIQPMNMDYDGDFDAFDGPYNMDFDAF